MRPVLLLLCIAAGLSACSPRFDWRRVVVDNAGFEAVLPCRPDRQTRTVPLADTPLQMTLLACEHGGHTFGLATVEVSDPAQVAPVLRALADAARQSVHGRLLAREPLQLTGGTPGADSLRMRLEGERPDGSAVHEAVWLFARGTRVYRATAIADQLDDSALAAFGDGLHFTGAR